MDTPLIGAVGGTEAAPETTRSPRRLASPQAPPLVPKAEFVASPAADALATRYATYQPQSEGEQSIQMVRDAFAIGYEAHDGQKRASGEPYIEHPIAVANILLDLRLDAASIAAALLHDVVEDTSITIEQIEQRFGREVAHLVDGVTKLTVLENQSKEDAQAGTYRKMFIAMADDPRVVLVKLADRLHNMRTISAMKQESQLRNARETMDIYAPLAHRLGIGQIKWELEDRSFAILNPDKYQEIRNALAVRRDAREKLVQRVITRLQTVLENEHIAASITGRPKHIYSIYRKMERKRVSLDQIYDQLAVRVIVSTVSECYQILGIVHSAWPPVPGEFDDYIANPKESMYQSLHTTVLIPGGQPCEIQIRTHQMHEIAEHGMAAHWRYKEGFGRTETSFDSKLAWLRNLIEWRRDLSAHDFIDSFKSDVLEDQVYVFTPKGKIVDLPLGSTPVDFAYRIHSQVGNSCVGAKVNNRMVSLDYELKSGEIVQIMTSKTIRGPSRDWLNFAHTSGARNHIRRYFKRLRRDENLSAGRDLLEKELKRFAVVMSFDEIAHTWGVKDIDELFVQIGSGETTARHVVQKLLTQQVKQEASDVVELPPAPPFPESAVDPRSIRLRGSDVDVPMRVARCCNPVAGEPIVGFVTRGRGITVHRGDCRVVLNEANRERLQDVEWGAGGKQQGYSVPVRIEAWDRVGLWRDITSLVADAKINIEKVEQVPTRKPGRAILMATLTIHSIPQMTQILDRLNRMNDVIEARREHGGALH